MTRIRLKKIESSDAAEIAKILSNKKVLKTLDPHHPFPVPVNYVKDKIPLDKENWKKGTAYKFVILQDKKIVGQISLYNPNKNKSSYEVGYFVSYDFWNKGIATEAVKKIIKYGFEKLSIKKIWSSVPKVNPSSIRVLEKAGMQKISENDKEIKLFIQQ